GCGRPAAGAASGAPRRSLGCRGRRGYPRPPGSHAGGRAEADWPLEVGASNVRDEQPPADESDKGTPKAPEPGKPRSKAAFWKELVILVGVAGLVAFLVRTFLVETFWIPSGSMEHTLDINDRVLVNKLVYDFRDPRRG